MSGSQDIPPLKARPPTTSVEREKGGYGHDYLINEGGIKPARLDTIGYGETRPLTHEPIPTDIQSKAAKANMRVFFEVIVK